MGQRAVDTDILTQNAAWNETPLFNPSYRVGELPHSTNYYGKPFLQPYDLAMTPLSTRGNGGMSEQGLGTK